MVIIRLLALKRKIGFHNKMTAHEIVNNLYKYGGAYSEFSLVYYYTIKRLFEKYSTKYAGGGKLSFLAREGLFLKNAFDIYLKYQPNNSITTKYFLCSRRSIQGVDNEELFGLCNTTISLRNFIKSFGFVNSEVNSILEEFHLFDFCDQVCVIKEADWYNKVFSNKYFIERLENKVKQNKEAFDIYIKDFYDEKNQIISVVDIGWKGYMQEKIQKYTGIHTVGYYLGHKNDELPLNDRIGLLFTYCPQRNIFSKYVYIMRANIALYEQLIAAPHGTVICYEKDEDGKVKVIEEWDESEKQLYNQLIKNIEAEMLPVISAFAAWDDGLDNAHLLKLTAKTICKTFVLSDKKRTQAIKLMDQKFLNNFNQEGKSLQYKWKEAPIGIDLFLSPDKYVRYVAKVQRLLLDKSLLYSAYRPIGFLFYYYALFVASLRAPKNMDLVEN